ncbi:hypothetical protein EKO23_15495 [Nocardioides guangzhouensis]|uniref:Uncharacterized protein n=1 Tax=Nocardioides guangzhouensis TaxID=2497878 RepID=A0A4V1XYU1_9ACTN|nr:hypothetical protein [Nocardioides guangzhouensis]RYP84429.1 hypothetical protein EKO23_15495 [Nocardioides guangzhouensis]
MRQTADRVTASLSGEAPGATRSLAYHLRTVRENLRGGCGTIPQPARQFLRAGLRMTRTPLSQAEYAQLVDRYEAWASGPTSSRRDGWLRRSLEACRRYRGKVSAGYAVWWEPTAAGRDWWVQITVDNNTDDLLDVSLGGSLWADGVPTRYRDPYGPDRHWGRVADQYTWGGSSADEVYAPPGRRIRTFVGIGAGYKVHLLRGGELFDIRPTVFVSPLREGGAPGCSLPVPRIN